MEHHAGAMDDRIISSAPKHYHMILCTDPVLYCRALHRITIPVMMCATARDINDYPEILQVTDYLLPSPTRRHDKALRHLILQETLRSELVKEEPEVGKQHATASQDADDSGAPQETEKKQIPQGSQGEEATGGKALRGRGGEATGGKALQGQGEEATGGKALQGQGEEATGRHKKQHRNNFNELSPPERGGPESKLSDVAGMIKGNSGNDE
eukprot:5424163-Amphidinium_carterae.1